MIGDRERCIEYSLLGEEHLYFVNLLKVLWVQECLVILSFQCDKKHLNACEIVVNGARFLNKRFVVRKVRKWVIGHIKM